jgi:hypothetical protein
MGYSADDSIGKMNTYKLRATLQEIEKQFLIAQENNDWDYREDRYNIRGRYGSQERYDDSRRVDRKNSERINLLDEIYIEAVKSVAFGDYDSTYDIWLWPLN